MILPVDRKFFFFAFFSSIIESCTCQQGEGDEGKRDTNEIFLHGCSHCTKNECDSYLSSH